MIRLKDARITDGIPSILRKKPEVQALSYAISKIRSKEIWTRISKLQIYANVDVADEEVLDAMAQELQVPAYRQSYAITIKRQLIKDAMPYWTTAGCAKVVEDLCKTIFGDAEVLEWWSFGGAPGTYKVKTTNPAVGAEEVEQFKKVAESIKRLSQHLINIDLELSVTGNLYAAGFINTCTTEILREA